MRKSNIFAFITLSLLVVFFGLLGLHPLLNGGHAQRWATEKQLVGSYGLTDICLFTEARYTRHLSQADLHAPFQDHPVSIEHFPSGSMVLPPAHLKATQPGCEESPSLLAKDRTKPATSASKPPSVRIAHIRPENETTDHGLSVHPN